VAYVESRTDSDTEPVAFRTGGDWLASDLVAFLSVIEDLYGTFVTVFEALAVRDQTVHQKLALAERLTGSQEGAVTSVLGGDDQILEYVVALSRSVFELRPEMRLTIVSIEMSSPGGISLAGLGEPIQQLREFIKDLWYRNKQEKQKGELEILREYLSIESEFGPLPPTVVERLAPEALEGVRVLDQLEQEGKLVEIPSTLGG
jgi:hypothetical protein